jgi:hypothetical protein
LRVAAAHWRIVLDESAAQPSMRRTRLLIVRATRQSYVVSALPDGYALVVVLARRAGFSGYERALSVCTLALGEEAGWTWDSLPKPAAWFPLDVLSDPRHRPRAFRDGDGLRPIEILGSIVNRAVARPRERGWRVRVDTGLEAMLVREPGGTWYSDEPVGASGAAHVPVGASGAAHVPVGASGAAHVTVSASGAAHVPVGASGAAHVPVRGTGERASVDLQTALQTGPQKRR